MASNTKVPTVFVTLRTPDAALNRVQDNVREALNPTLQAVNGLFDGTGALSVASLAGASMVLSSAGITPIDMISTASPNGQWWRIASGSGGNFNIQQGTSSAVGSPFTNRFVVNKNGSNFNASGVQPSGTTFQISNNGTTTTNVNLEFTNQVRDWLQYVNTAGWMIWQDNTAGSAIRVTIDTSGNLAVAGNIQSGFETAAISSGNAYLLAQSTAVGGASAVLQLLNTARDWQLYNAYNGVLTLLDNTAGQNRLTVDTSGNFVFTGSIAAPNHQMTALQFTFTPVATTAYVPVSGTPVWPTVGAGSIAAVLIAPLTSSVTAGSITVTPYTDANGRLTGAATTISSTSNATGLVNRYTRGAVPYSANTSMYINYTTTGYAAGAPLAVTVLVYP